MAEQSGRNKLIAGMPRANPPIPPMDFFDLPAERYDNLWETIQTAYGLSIPELSAIKNARCSAGKHP